MAFAVTEITLFSWTTCKVITGPLQSRIAGTGMFPVMNTCTMPHFDSLNFLNLFSLVVGAKKALFSLSLSKRLSLMSPSPSVSQQCASVKLRLHRQSCKDASM